MNASLSAALLLVLLAGGWLLGRRRTRPFLRSTDTSAVAALNRLQIERLQPPAPEPAPASQSALSPEAEASPAPASPRAPGDAHPGTNASAPLLPLQAGERRRRLRQLQVWMLSGSRAQRLQALAAAAQSSRRDVLPLLRRGLRDSDPAVMAAAAAAMVRFRGRTAAAPLDSAGRQPWRGGGPQPGSAAISRPRSVRRTR